MSTLHQRSLTAQLKATLPKIKGDRPLAFRCPGGWAGSPQIVVDGRTMEVRECRSDLEVREALSSVEPSSLVLLIRKDNVLSEDSVARLAKGKLWDLDPRESLLSVTGAQSVDPLLLMHRDVMRHLLERWEPDVRLASVSGNIECGRVFAFLLNRGSLAAEAPDLVELLAWTWEDGMHAVSAAPAAVRAAFFDWIREKNGPVTTPLAVALGTCGKRLVPLGLVLDVLYPASGGTDAAHVRLERYLGNEHLTASLARSWHDAAVVLLGRLGEGQQRALLTDADAWLEELKSHELAESSRFSPAGFGLRLDAFAKSLEAAQRNDSQKAFESLRQSAARVEDHWLNRLEKPRMETIQMALRLVQWLRAPQKDAEGCGPGVLASRFLQDDAFVDWARQRVRRGDGNASLNKALAALLAKVDQRRKVHNERFAEALQNWIARDEPDPDMIPIEEVIGEVIVPVAMQATVLLLVLDGMNGAVFSELLTDLAARHWHPLRSAEHRLPRPVLAALPSITEVSREALFRGRIDYRDPTTEGVNFRDHPLLHRHITSRQRPQLFLKPTLADPGGTGLSAEVSKAITGKDHRVVAVVINAVDDQLSTHGQLSLSWNVHQITWLKELLDAASQGGRVVVLMSDHGHVLGKETDRSLQLKSVDGDRWRTGEPAPGPGEMLVKGRRIEEAVAAGQCVVSVSESLRYGVRKSGYHGGASDQEVVVPLAILSHRPEDVPGFEPVDPEIPAWWQLAPREGAPGVTMPVAPRRRKPSVEPPAPPLELWSAVGQPESAASRPAPATPPWIQALLDSEVLVQQRRLAQRISASITGEALAKLLMILDSRGGAVPSAAVAAELGMPQYKIGGFISNVQRLLNVEGYAVLELDGSQTVRLNRELLNSQFVLPT